jgi:uncharacterized membrane protein YfcA
MTPLLFTLITFVASIAAGVLGSLLGLGGGIIVIPVLTLLLHIDIRYAIGASIVSVIATSSGGAAAYVRDHMANIRVAMVLEIATAAGALTGAYVGGIIAGRWLFVVFGLVLAYTALSMLRSHEQTADTPVKPCKWCDRLRLHDSYPDKQLGRDVPYRVTALPFGFGISYIAGIVSGLLGIGGGALKVPAMHLVMRIPLKVCSATSNFMIGVTAAASAGVYFTRGLIDPFIAAPVAAGILIGATIGATLLSRLKNSRIKVTFVIILLIVSAQMLWKGFHDQSARAESPAAAQTRSDKKL